MTKILLRAAMLFMAGPVFAQLEYQVINPLQFDNLTDTRVDFADVDGDDDQDVAMIGQLANGSWTTRLYKNNGGGNFSLIPGTPFITGTNGSVRFADIDGDNDQDVLITATVASNQHEFIFYLNNGTGDFTSTKPLAPGDGRHNLFSRFADFDGDNDLDLIFTSATSAGYGWGLSLNDGAGNFETVQGSIGADDASIGIADIDDDADLDFFIAGYSTTFFSFSTLQQNDGSGNFSEITSSLPRSVRYGANFLDADDDGDQDLLYTFMRGLQSDNETTRLFLNDGTGQFIATVTPPLQKIGTADVADVNEDGFPDVILSGADVSGKYVELYLNDKHNKFARASIPPFEPLSGEVKFFDADGDGDMDLLLASKLYLLQPCIDDSCIGPVTSISEEDEFEAAGFLLFPNPVRDVLNIEIKSTNFESVSFEINDSFGRAMVSKHTVAGATKHTVDLHNFTPGIYFIVVHRGNFSVAKKIIKR